MGRVVAVLAVLLVVLLALDAAGIVPLLISKERARDDEGSELASGEATDDGSVALRGAGRDQPDEEDPAPAEEPTPEDLHEVRGTTTNGGVLRGRVVQGTPPLPVADVRVTLNRPDSIFSYLRAQVNGRFDQLEARTGDDGRFAFLDITPSPDYVVRAIHPEFAVASARGKIDLRSGGEQDIGDLPLGQGGQIAGRVLDPRGDPVPNAHVVVTWVIQNALNSIVTEPSVLPEIEREVRTDDEGRFRIERLEPGWKTVILKAPNGATAAHPRLKIDDGKTFDVGDWQLTGTHFIGGRVLWSSGQPVVGTRVVAAPFGRPEGRQAITDADGRFKLEHLPHAPNYAIGTMVPGLPVALETKVTLDSDEHEIRIATPARLRGRVVDEDSGKPVTKFRILTTQKPTGVWIQDLIAKQVTRALGPTPFEDAEGRFVFERMAVGSFTLQFTASGHPPHQTQVDIAVGDDKELVIKLPSGKRAVGEVVGTDGAPIANARVFVYKPGVLATLDMRALDRSLRQRMPATTADDEGRFQLPPQSPGTYDLVAEADGKRPGIVKGARLGHEDVEGVRIVLPPSTRITGHIVGPQGQRLAEEVGVAAVFSDYSWTWGDTDERGHFAFERVPIGRVILRWGFEVDQSIFSDLEAGGDKAVAAYEKLANESEEATLRDGKPLEVTITIPRRTLVKGRVMSSGAPATGARGVYWLKQPDGQRWQWSRCDDRGRFTHRLVPGLYDAYIPTVKNNWIPQKIQIPDMNEFELEIERPSDPE